jgi:hypothetical protein
MCRNQYGFNVEHYATQAAGGAQAHAKYSSQDCYTNQIHVSSFENNTHILGPSCWPSVNSLSMLVRDRSARSLR